MKNKKNISILFNKNNILLILFFVCVLARLGLWHLSRVAYVIIIILNYNKRNRYLPAVNKSKYIWAYFLIIGISILTTLFSIALGRITDIKPFYREVPCLFILLGYATYILLRSQEVKTFYVSLRNLSFILTIFGFFEHLHGYNMLLGIMNVPQDELNGLVGNGRIFSIFGHAIAYGSFLIISLVILIAYPYKNIFFTVFHGGLIIINIIYTHERTAIFAFAFLVVILIISRIITTLSSRNLKNVITTRDIKRGILVIAISIPVLITILRNHAIIDYLSRYFSYLNTLFDIKTNAIRYDAILRYVQYLREGNILSILFGNGVGYVLEYIQLYPLHGWWTKSPDNQYVSILFDYGVVGFCFISLTIIRAWRMILMYYRQKIYKEVFVSAAIYILISVSIISFNGLDWPAFYMLYVVTFLNIIKSKEKSKSIIHKTNSNSQQIVLQ